MHVPIINYQYGKQTICILITNGYLTLKNQKHISELNRFDKFNIKAFLYLI